MLNMEKIKEVLGEVIVEETEVTKNNGVVKKGVRISREGENVAPVIYIPDDMIDEDEITEYVISSYKESAASHVDLDFSKENVMRKVYPAIVNAERNAQSDIVQTPFLNLAVIYKFDVSIGETKGSVTIKKEHLKQLGISESELHTQAMKNVQSSGEAMSLAEALGMPWMDDELQMMVVTNKSKVYGAGVIFDEALIERLKERFGSKFYVLPSSVHEMLVVPADVQSGVTGLVEMVKSVNATEVSAQDYLSDSVYFYNGQKLEVA